MRLPRPVISLVGVALLVAALAGCVGEPMPVPTYTPTGSATPSATPDADPVFRPNGSAAANQQYFDFVNQAWNNAHQMSDGRSIVDNLVAAGFTKADMEVTADTTALNIPVDGIQVSVRIKQECLIAQFSNAGYTGILAPVLATGKCLVGQTRPIDW